MNTILKSIFPALLLLLAQSTVFASEPQSTQAVPAFSLPGLAGTTDAPITLSDYKGQVVYVDFWASWCGPCRKSLPQLNKLRAELGPKGFEVIAINVDEFEEDALAFLDRYPVDYPLAWDGDGAVAKLYKVRGMPTSYLLNQSGELVYIHEGFRDGDIDEIRTKVTSLLMSSSS